MSTYAMSRPLRIRVDCDGVLADFTSAYLEILVRQTGRFVFYNDVTDFHFEKCVASKEENAAVWDEIDNTPGLVTCMRWLPGAREALADLRALGEVTCLTSPHIGPYWVYERQGWLERAGFTKRQQTFSSDKSLVHGDVLIDDHVDNLIEFGNENPQAMLLLVDQPWNRVPQHRPSAVRRITRVGNLSEAVHALEMLEEYRR